MAMKWCIVVLCLLALIMLVSGLQTTAEAEDRQVGAVLKQGLNKIQGALSGKGTGKALPKRKKFTGAADKIKEGDENCVVCQYFVQRVSVNLALLSSSSAAGMATGAVASSMYPFYPYSPFSMLEKKETTTTPTTAAASATTAAAAATTTTPTGEGAASPSLLETEQILKGAMMELMKSNNADNRRHRITDMLPYRPGRVRYNPPRMGGIPGIPNFGRLAERAQYTQLYQSVFFTFKDLCTLRTPLAYYKVCQKMMLRYRKIAEGLWYHDRPDEICMGINVCKKDSYLGIAPHSLFRISFRKRLT